MHTADEYQYFLSLEDSKKQRDEARTTKIERLLPPSQIACPACGSHQVVYRHAQNRHPDEGMDAEMLCRNSRCNKTWRQRS